MGFTDSWVNASLQAIVTAGAWAALHYDDPSLGGLGLSEITGGSYARQAIPWGSVSGRAVWSNAGILFAGLPATTLKFLGVWDSPSGGSLIGYAPISPSIPVAAGTSYPVASGDISLNIA